MKLSAVAPPSPAPAPRPAPEAAEIPAVPFEETLLRVQAKAKPAAETPVPPTPVDEEQPLAEEAVAEEPQAEAVTAPPLPQISEPILDDLLPPMDEHKEPEDEPADEPVLLLATMPAELPAAIQPVQVQTALPPSLDGQLDDEPAEEMPQARPALAEPATGHHTSQPRREAIVPAQVQPVEMTPSPADEMPDTPARSTQPSPAEELPPTPNAQSVADAPVLPAKPEPSASVPVDAPPVAVPHPSSPQTHAPAPTAPAVPTPSIPQEAAFAETNHPTMIDAIRAHALPDGGRMQIKLDPPQLGSLEIHVEVRDGILTASFQTSSDEATRLLGHSLSQLKHSLESQGLSVDRLQVQQAPRDQQASSDPDPHDNPQRQQHPHDQSGQQDRQRREMLRRLWRRVAGDRDPLDLLA